MGNCLVCATLNERSTHYLQTIPNDHYFKLVVSPHFVFANLDCWMQSKKSFTHGHAFIDKRELPEQLTIELYQQYIQDFCREMNVSMKFNALFVAREVDHGVHRYLFEFSWTDESMAILEKIRNE